MSTEQSPNDVFWVRVKPYNKQKGHLLQRVVLSSKKLDKALRKIWTGGDGIYVVPEWCKVTRDQAESIKDLRQSEKNPESPRIFDIVTQERKNRIDNIEEDHRKAILGYGRSITSMPNVSAVERDMTGNFIQETSLDDLASGTEEGLPVMTQATAKKVIGEKTETDLTGSVISKSEVEVTGRVSAMEGFEESNEESNEELDEESNEESPLHALPAIDPPVFKKGPGRPKKIQDSPVVTE